MGDKRTMSVFGSVTDLTASNELVRFVPIVLINVLECANEQY